MDKPKRKLIAVDGKVKLTSSGYPEGQKLKTHAGDRLYQVQKDGSFKRLTPKPPSKKERRKSRERKNR